MCKILKEMCEEAVEETRKEDKKISHSLCLRRGNILWKKLWICPVSPWRR